MFQYSLALSHLSMDLPKDKWGFKRRGRQGRAKQKTSRTSHLLGAESIALFAQSASANLGSRRGSWEPGLIAKGSSQEPGTERDDEKVVEFAGSSKWT